MKPIDRFFADYAIYHQTRGNLLCHTIGIPLIIYSLLGMLLQLQLVQLGNFTVTAAEGLILIAMFVYAWLDIRFMGMMLMIAVALDVVARSWGHLFYFASLFVIGWIFQGIGHAVFEKRSPAFFRNFLHLLVGPIFILNEYIRLRPILPTNLESRER